MSDIRQAASARLSVSQPPPALSGQASLARSAMYRSADPDFQQIVLENIGGRGHLAFACPGATTCVSARDPDGGVSPWSAPRHCAR